MRSTKKKAPASASAGADAGASDLDWRSRGVFLAAVEMKERRLAVQVSPQDPGWLVVAFELPGGDLTLEGAFADHSHKTVGEYPTVTEAIRAGESFAAAWKAGHKSAHRGEPCACGEIVP